MVGMDNNEQISQILGRLHTISEPLIQEDIVSLEMVVIWPLMKTAVSNSPFSCQLRPIPIAPVFGKPAKRPFMSFPSSPILKLPLRPMFWRIAEQVVCCLLP